MASGNKRKTAEMLMNDTNEAIQYQSVNELKTIETDVKYLTSTIIHDILKSFIRYMNEPSFGPHFLKEKLFLIEKCPSLSVKNLIPELNYDDEQILKKIYFHVLYFVLNNHGQNLLSNTPVANNNLRRMLSIITKANIFNKFEEISLPSLHLSPYFSLLTTFTLTILSHRTISTQDVCLYGTIVFDSLAILTKKVSDSPGLKEIIQLLRNILKVEFVQNVYLQLINDECQYAKPVVRQELAQAIDQIIDEIFVERGISFANLSTCFSSVACFNRLVVLNKNVIVPMMLDDEDSQLRHNSIMNASIIIILLHEMFHILRRTIIRSATNLFYSRTPKRSILSRNNIEVEEGGTQVEDRLFGFVVDSIGYSSSLFLLTIANWQELSHEQFKRFLHSAKESDETCDSTNPDDNPKRHLWYLPSEGDSLIEETKNTTNEIKPKSRDLLWLGTCGTPHVGQY